MQRKRPAPSNARRVAVCAWCEARPDRAVPGMRNARRRRAVRLVEAGRLPWPPRPRDGTPDGAGATAARRGGRPAALADARATSDDRERAAAPDARRAPTPDPTLTASELARRVGTIADPGRALARAAADGSQDRPARSQLPGADPDRDQRRDRRPARPRDRLRAVRDRRMLTSAPSARHPRWSCVRRLHGRDLAGTTARTPYLEHDGPERWPPARRPGGRPCSLVFIPRLLPPGSPVARSAVAASPRSWPRCCRTRRWTSFAARRASRRRREGLEGFVNAANALITPALVAMAAVAPLGCIVGAGALMFGSRRGMVIIGASLGTLIFLGSVKGIVA